MYVHVYIYVEKRRKSTDSYDTTPYPHLHFFKACNAIATQLHALFYKGPFIRSLHVEGQKTEGTFTTKGPIIKELYNENLMINFVDI